MPRDTADSIPFYNKNKELIASYNVYLKMLYVSRKITPEEQAEVIAKLEKKKYKGFQVWDYTPAVIPDKKRKATLDEEEESEEESIEEIEASKPIEDLEVEPNTEVKPKRKRRTKAEMEAARAKGEK